MLTVSTLLIIIFLGLLIYYSFKGVGILYLAPVLSTLLIICMELANIFVGDGIPATGSDSGFFLGGLTGSFMKSIVGYINGMFLVFLVGSMFGNLIEVSGSGVVIGRWVVKSFGEKYAMLAVVVATAILTYGGVSLFVVVFAMYPIASHLFKELNIPKRLIPGAIALGAFTFTMTSLPGSPQALNVLPTAKLGTNIYAAPILGIFGSVILFILGMLWLSWRQKMLVKKGEGYGDHASREGVLPEQDKRELPSIVKALTPIFLVFVLNFLITNYLFKGDSMMKKLLITVVNGQWTVLISLGIAILLSLYLFRKQIKNPLKALNDGAQGAVLPLFNTATIIGFGGVIKDLSTFGGIKGLITGLKIAPIWKVAISTTLLSGIVGSSSGGTGITLDALGDEFLSYASLGLSPDVVHRIMLMAAGGLDSLPHCGAVISLLMVTKLTHRESYLDVGVTTVIIPLFSVVATILLYLATGVH